MSLHCSHSVKVPVEKKGCGKSFVDKFWGERICGNFEDLKHSDHYIYCDECSQATGLGNKKKATTN